MAPMSESSGNGPQRPGQSRLAAGANTPMAKTVALVVVALIIGIVMINIVGDGGSTAKTTSKTTASTAPNGTTPTTSSTTRTTAPKTTTTKKAGSVVPPASLKLIVVNSGAPAGSGGNVKAALTRLGYTSQAPTIKVSWSEKGLTVHCKPGLESERSALVKALAGVPNYTAAAATWKAQPGIPAAEQCYVAIGAPK